MLVLIPSFAPAEMSIAHLHTSPDAGYMGDGDHLHCLFVTGPLDIGCWSECPVSELGIVSVSSSA